MKIHKKTKILTGITIVSAMLLKFASKIFLPFIVGFIFAYLCSDIVKHAKKKGINPNIVAIILILAILLTSVLLLFHAINFALAKVYSLAEFLKEEPLKNIDKNSQIMVALSNFSINIDELINSRLKSLIVFISNSSIFIINKIQTLIAAIISNTLNLLLIPIISYNFMIGWDRISENIVSIVPKTAQKSIKETIADISENMSKYFKGQFIVVFILTVVYAFLLYLSGLSNYILLGLLMGLSSFIPFIGSICVFALVFITSIAQFGGDITSSIKVIGYLSIGQIIDSSIVTPKIIGDSIQIGANWIIFGLIMCTAVFGIAGALLSMPIITICSCIIKNMIKYYRSSEFFKK